MLADPFDWWTYTGVAPDSNLSLLLLCTRARQYTNLVKITHTDRGPFSQSCHSRATMCRPPEACQSLGVQGYSP